MPRETIGKQFQALTLETSPIRRPKYNDQKAMPIRMERLLAFIVEYQAKHNKQTPTVDTLANEMETTTGIVMYWLRILDTRGKIHFISQWPLRVMVRADVSSLDDARRMDDALVNKLPVDGNGSTAYERYQLAEQERHQLARFIGGYHADHGHGPSLREMMEFLNTTNGNRVSRMLDILEEKGYVARQPDVPGSLHLTANGRIAFMSTITIDRNTNRQARLADALQTALQRNAAKFNEKVVTVHDWMVRFTRAEQRYPTKTEATDEYQRITKTTSKHPLQEAFREMKRRGWLLEGGPGRSQTVLNKDGTYILNETRVVAAPAFVPVQQETGPTGRARRMSPARRAEKIIQFIAAFWNDWGRGPQYSDIAEAVGYKKSAGVAKNLDYLEDLGYVTRIKNKQGSVKVTPLGAEKFLKPLTTPNPVFEEPAPRPDPVPVVDPTVKTPATVSVTKVSPPQPASPATVSVTKVSSPQPAKTLKDYDSIDLMLELQERGFIVKRA